MNENNTGARMAFLFLAVLGISGAIGLAVMRSAAPAAEPPDEAIAEPIAKAQPEKKEEEPVVKKAQPAPKKKVVRWEGGGESDVAARRAGMKVWAGPASMAPGRFGSGAAYVPQPVRIAQPKVEVSRGENGKTTVTTYRPGR